MRKNNRSPNQLRELKIETGFNEHAEGSALIHFGSTQVLCTASLDESIPRWLQGEGRGWVTGEYGMLPRSTNTRIRRDKAMNSGRTQEISRLIARALRSCIDLEKLGERQITVDCDVIQADGGTRTAAITGGFIALALAVEKLLKAEILTENPLTSYVAAISVGLTDDNQVLLDLDYDEDSSIGTDMNVVMLSNGGFVEIQGTAEKGCFSQQQLSEILGCAHSGCDDLFKMQAGKLGHFFKPEAL